MIYPEIRVPIPDMGGYTRRRGSVVYSYVYIGDRQTTTDGGTTHPKSKCIGRIELDQDNKPELMPNSFYYQLMGLSQPEVAVAEGVGRKPWKPKQTKAETREKYEETAVGYGLAIMLLAAELELTSVLKESFGEELGKKILTIAAFLCERSHSSFDGLAKFVGSNLIGTNLDVTLDRRAAGQVLVELTPEKRGKFYDSWISKHPCGLEVFYDVTSFSTYSGQIIRAHYGYNRDHDDLPQINQGLFCDRETGLPLFMCAYDGSVNDKTNFNYALKRAREHGLGIGHAKRKICIVTDGGFSARNVDWSHFLGYDIIIGVSCDYLKDVREAYVNWSSQLTEADRAHTWLFGESCYISNSIPFKLGNVDGELMMYRDLFLEYDKRRQLTRIKNEKKKELDETETAPKTQFEKWAKRFEPYFKVVKSAGRKGFTYEEDLEGFASLCDLCGKVTLFVSRKYHKLTEQQCLEVYRSKESVEDCFDTSKNGLSDKRLHIQGDRQVEGKLFAMFVSLILRRAFHSRIKDYIKKNGLSDESAIRELENITFYKGADGWCLKDALSKTQREILQQLNLKLRNDAEVNLAMFKQRVRKGKKSKLTDPALFSSLTDVLTGTI
ncbi:MAG: transposase [Succinivibrionaceae bacterium]|nr:transposase [Succinivibrionaceae bacterium]